MERKARLQGQEQTFRLPTNVSGPTDIARLARELESLENYLYQAGVRHATADTKLPKTSRAFDDITTLNHLNVLLSSDRKKLAGFLKIIHVHAPVMHISFSVDPSAAFVTKIVDWLRQNISPFMLVQVGRQPTIGGGCMVRTTNKQFDFSFRQYLDQHRDVLAQTLADIAHKSEKAKV